MDITDRITQAVRKAGVTVALGTLAFVVPALATPPSSPLQSQLSLSEKPLLGKPVTLRYTFTSILPAPNTIATIELPEHFVLVSGHLAWRGRLAAQEEQRVTVVIKATKVGYCQLKASVFFDEGERSRSGHADSLDLEITPNDAILGSRPENHWDQDEGLPGAHNNQAIKSQLLISSAPELHKEFTVTYRVTPHIDLPDPQSAELSLGFPLNAFQVVSVGFPPGGTTDPHDARLIWKGAMARGQTVDITATFRVMTTGGGWIYGSLRGYEVVRGTSFIHMTTSFTDTKAARLSVDKYDGGTFTLR